MIWYFTVQFTHMNLVEPNYHVYNWVFDTFGPRSPEVAIYFTHMLMSTHRDDRIAVKSLLLPVPARADLRLRNC